MKKIFLGFSFLLLTFCNSNKKQPNSKIEIYDNSIESIIDISATVEIIADSIALPEGPSDKYFFKVTYSIVPHPISSIVLCIKDVSKINSTII